MIWIALVVVFVAMNIGNIVSATGSGLACPDWPRCHGMLIPPMLPGVPIEYGHRIMAALATLSIVAVVITTLRRHGRQIAARQLCWTLLALVVVQGLLGGITVLLKLPTLISTAHLVTALVIFGCLLVLAARTHGGTGAAPKTARLARAGLAVLLFQLALGGYVRHSGAGLACPDFPLCSGDVFPGHWLAVAHWTHRWLGVLLLGLFIHLAIAGRRTGLAGITAVTAALAIVQVSLGVAAVLWRLDPPVRAAHAAVGYALWAALVWTAARSGGLRPLTSPAHELSAVAGARLA